MGKDNSLVSICMPAYNTGSYIAAAVQSIIAQSYQNWELIIVNDGSTDRTLAELEKIKDNRINVVSQENEGQCSAVNKAYSLSKGSLIKFMDADDLISERFIENQVNTINNSNNTIAYATWGRFYKDNLNTFRPDEDFIKKDMKPGDWIIASMKDKQVMLQCSLWLIPRQVLDKSGLWNETLSLINDFEFIIRVLLCADELKFAPNSILYYRSGIENSLSGTKSIKAAESAYNSINLGTRHLLKYEDSRRTRRIAADCFQRFIFTFYPDHKTMTTIAEIRIKELGGSAIPFPAGGYTRLMALIIGWRWTQNIKRLFKR